MATLVGMPRHAQPVPDDVRGETLSTGDALAAGIHPDRLRRADVRHPFHGVVTFGNDPQTVADRAWAYARVMADAGWYSNSTAAALRGLPLPTVLRGAPLHITVPRGDHSPRGRGVIGHQRDLEAPAFETVLVPLSTGEVVPLRVGTIGTTLLTTATELGLADLVAIIDAARLADDRGTLADIERMLARSARRAGGARLRRGMALSRAGVRSRPETHLRLLLARAGFPEPEVAPDVETPIGVLHPDLAWPQWRVLVEYEGDGHRTDSRVFASDLQRFDAFVDADWSTVRCSRVDLYAAPRRVLESLARRLRSRGWSSAARLRTDIPPIAVP